MKKKILLSALAVFLVAFSHAQRPRPRTSPDYRDRDRAETDYRWDRGRDWPDGHRGYYEDRGDHRDRGFVHPHHRGYYQKGRYYYYDKQAWKKWRSYPQCTCPYCRPRYAPRRDQRYDYDEWRYRHYDPRRGGCRN